MQTANSTSSKVVETIFLPDDILPLSRTVDKSIIEFDFDPIYKNCNDPKSPNFTEKFSDATQTLFSFPIYNFKVRNEKVVEFILDENKFKRYFLPVSILRSTIFEPVFLQFQTPNPDQNKLREWLKSHPKIKNIRWNYNPKSNNMALSFIIGTNTITELSLCILPIFTGIQPMLMYYNIDAWEDVIRVSQEFKFAISQTVISCLNILIENFLDTCNLKIDTLTFNCWTGKPIFFTFSSTMLDKLTSDDIGFKDKDISFSSSIEHILKRRVSLPQTLSFIHKIFALYHRGNKNIFIKVTQNIRHMLRNNKQTTNMQFTKIICNNSLFLIDHTVYEKFFRDKKQLFCNNVQCVNVITNPHSTINEILNPNSTINEIPNHHSTANEILSNHPTIDPITKKLENFLEPETPIYSSTENVDGFPFSSDVLESNEVNKRKIVTHTAVTIENSSFSLINETDRPPKKRKIIQQAPTTYPLDFQFL